MLPDFGSKWEAESNELLNQGIVLLKEGQYDRAIGYFNKAVGHAEAYYNRGLVYVVLFFL